MRGIGQDGGQLGEPKRLMRFSGWRWRIVFYSVVSPVRSAGPVSPLNSMKIFSISLVLFLVLTSNCCFGQTYQLTDLGAWVGTNSYAQGINNQGQVVGYWDATNGAHAFLYQTGTVIDLGLLGVNGTNVYALSINNSGQVVGFSESTNGAQAFIYQHGNNASLGTLGSLGSYAFGINNGGQIVGYLATSNGAQAFLYNNGVLFNVGNLGGTNSFAYGVNDAIQVAGSSLEADNATWHAFLWQNGVNSDLNHLIPYGSAWNLSEAHGINDLGNIAGWGVINGHEHAFLFFNSGFIIDLGTLFGGTNSYALGFQRFRTAQTLLPMLCRQLAVGGPDNVPAKRRDAYDDDEGLRQFEPVDERDEQRGGQSVFGLRLQSGGPADQPVAGGRDVLGVSV